MRIIGKHAALIIDSIINESDRWDVTEHTISLKGTDLEVWIGCSGFFFVGIWRNSKIRSAFNLIEKRLIWKLARPLTMMRSTPSYTKTFWRGFIMGSFAKDQPS